jgi:hypothetical protein
MHVMGAHVLHANAANTSPTIMYAHDSPQPPALVFPGDGIFFWWQAGVVSALQKRYNLGDLQMAGASAGSLSAVSAACNLNMHDGLELALRLSEEAGAWDKGTFGLYGIWGDIVREWLDTMLPENAHVTCSGSTHLAVKTVSLRMPPVTTRLVSEFESRTDLIDCTMASLHIPWFMDRHATTDGAARGASTAPCLCAQRQGVSAACTCRAKLGTCGFGPKMTSAYGRATRDLRASSPGGWDPIKCVRCSAGVRSTWSGWRRTVS